MLNIRRVKMLRGKVKVLSLVAKAILVLVCLALIISNLINLCPSLVSADLSFTILGGSMQPTLFPGDLIFTKKVDPANIQEGDIITIEAEKIVYTHRVVKKLYFGGGFLFQTKGDANEDPDARYVKSSEIVGKVVYVIPLRYLYTPYGYVILVITPFCLIIGKQFVKMYKFLNRYKRRIVGRRGLKGWLQRLAGIGRGRGLRSIQVLDTTSFLLFATILLSSTRMVFPIFLGGGLSYFSDVESVSCEISADTWMVQSAITCSVSPNPANLGESVTIAGEINPPRTVTIVINRPNGTIYDSVAVPTNNNGAYSYVFTPDQTGKWVIKVSWHGDSSYYGSSCQTKLEVLG